MFFRVVKLDVPSVFVDTIRGIHASLVHRQSGASFDLLTENTCPALFELPDPLAGALAFDVHLGVVPLDAPAPAHLVLERAVWTRVAPPETDYPGGYIGCVHPRVTDGTTPYELRLVIEPVDITAGGYRGTRLAPPLVTRPPAPRAAPPLSVGLRVADASRAAVASVSNAHDEADPLRYLVMPGNYTGDSWHIAAALLLDESARVAIPTKDSGQFKAKTDQFMSFCEDCGIGTDPLRRLSSPNLSHLGNVSGPQAAAAAQKIITADLSTLRRDEEDPVCGWTFASTSLILAHAEERGVLPLHGVLRAVFPEEPPRDAGYHDLLRLIEDEEPCVLVNMRRGVMGNHPQHNMTRAIFDQVCTAIRGHGLRVVRIGTYQDPTFTPGAAWMRDDLTEDAHGTLVEIFTQGRPDNRRYTSWFWAKVALMGNVHGVIGGRSGSLDVAAFMGVRTFCWDLVDVTDHEYARLFLAFPLMSIGRRGAINGHDTDPTGILAAEDLNLWLSGHHVIPDHGGVLDRFPRPIMALCGKLSELTGAGSIERNKRVLMKRLAYLDPFVAPAVVAPSAPLSSVSAMVVDPPAPPAKHVETKEHKGSAPSLPPPPSSRRGSSHRGAMSGPCIGCETNTRSKRTCMATMLCPATVFLCGTCSTVLEARCPDHQT